MFCFVEIFRAEADIDKIPQEDHGATPGACFWYGHGLLCQHMDDSIFDLDRVDFQVNTAGHGDSVTSGDIEGAEMPATLDDLAVQIALLRERDFAMGADIAGRVDLSADIIDGE